MEGLSSLLDGRVVLAEPIVRLRRGDDQGILVAAERTASCSCVPERLGRPFFCERGFGYVERLLDDAASSPTLGALVDARPDDAGLLRLLVEHGLLVPATRTSREADVPSMDGALPGASLYLLLSQRCNMACGYCLAGERSYGEGKPPRMSLETALTAIERAFESLSPRGSLEIVFFGGEPMLGFDTAKDVLLASRSERFRAAQGQRSVRFHFTTNLTLLPPEALELAKEFRCTFLVDVDGPPDVHDRIRPLRGGRGTHETIEGNLQRLAAAGLEYALRATITSLNVDRMVEVSKHHRALGGNSSALVALSPVDSDEQPVPLSLLPDPARYGQGLRDTLARSGWRSDQLFPFNEWLGRVRHNGRMVQACGAPYGSTPVVDSVGSIYPCIYWVGIERLRTGTLADPNERRDVLVDLKDRLHVDRREGCRTCDLRYLCGGGCPARSVALEGREVAPKLRRYVEEIGCVVSRVVLEELLWEEATRVATSPTPSSCSCRRETP